MRRTTETRESFITKANARYSDFYDYSKVEYVNQSTPVTIACPLHGEFSKTPSVHLHGGGCPVCSKIKAKEYWTPERRAEKSRQMREESLEKRNQTMMEKYGVTSWSQSKDAKKLANDGKGPWAKDSRARAAATCEERFGAKTWAESDTGRTEASERCADPAVRARMSEVASAPEVREKTKATNIARYGAEYWSQSPEGRATLKKMFAEPTERFQRRERMLRPETKAKIQATSIERYGTPYYWQSDAGRERLKVLLAAADVRERTAATNMERYGCETWQGSEDGHRKLSSAEVQEKRYETCEERYGAHTWGQSDEGRAVLGSDEMLSKIHARKKENGSYNRSIPEDMLYSMLCDRFGADSVERQYRSKAYRFNCDFYVRPLDAYIELNASWMHGDHWFDADNVDDVEHLQCWMSIDKPMYAKAIDVWTRSDPEKRDAARDADLNYIVFWNNDLSDAKEWFDNSCPIRKDW